MNISKINNYQQNFQQRIKISAPTKEELKNVASVTTGFIASGAGVVSSNIVLGTDVFSPESADSVRNIINWEPSTDSYPSSFLPSLLSTGGPTTIIYPFFESDMDNATRKNPS